jgi:hypothetical protein
MVIFASEHKRLLRRPASRTIMTKHIFLCRYLANQTYVTYNIQNKHQSLPADASLRTIALSEHAVIGRNTGS